MNAQSLFKVLAAVCVGSLGLATFGQTGSTAVPSSSKASPSTEAVIHYGQLPLSFEPNLGQTSSQVQWIARGPEYTLFLAGHDAVLELSKIVPAKRGSIIPDEMTPHVTSYAVRMNLLGANAPLHTVGEDPQTGKANYFTGKDPSKWQHDVPMSGKVRMTGVYPGIDLVYYGRRGQLEYDFVVAPGADASAIQLRFDGAKARLAANGDLLLPVDGAPDVRFDKPVVYQMKNGVRQPVDGRFAIADSKAGQQVSFRLGAFDHSRELVIDPTLLFLGTLGTGNQQTIAEGMTVDSLGEIILTGITNDLSFPVTSGAMQTVCTNLSAAAAAAGWTRCGVSSASSGFVTKISADGTSLVYSTYLHGLSGAEYGSSVATDSAGDAYVLGMTSSNDFPITADAIQTYCQPNFPEIGFNDPPVFGPETTQCDNYADGGGTEYTVNGPTLFVAKLNPTGSALLYATFFGGTAPTYPEGIALDSSLNIYFTSFLQTAFSADNSYPVNGNIPFPVTSNAYQTLGANLRDATLTELSADGHTVLYSTLFGSENSTTTDFAFTYPLALAVGPNGIAYVGGVVSASQNGYPVTAGVVKPGCTVNPNPAYAGNCIADTGWLAAFDTTQSGAASLKYSTYIGGAEIAGGAYYDQAVLGLAADSDNNVYVAGYTLLPTYPTTAGAYQTTCNYNNAGNLCHVAFLTKINPAGTAYIWSTMYGSNPSPFDTEGNAIAFDSFGRVYLYGLAIDDGANWVNPIEGYFQGNKIFIATFSGDGSTLEFGTPVGNTDPSVVTNEEPINNNGLFVDADGNMYFAGVTADSGTMVTTPGTYSTAAAGGFNRTYFGKISPVGPEPAVLLTPAPSSTLTGSSVNFTWTTGAAATEYVLRVGSTGVGSTNLYNGPFTTNTSVTLNNLPLNGETIYIQLWSLVSGKWLYFNYTCTAFTGTAATLNPLSGGSTLSGISQLFTWTAGTGVTQYELRVGSTGVGSSNLYNGPFTTSTSATVNNLPLNGETIYVRLSSLAGGLWLSNDYTFSAFTGTAATLNPLSGGNTLGGISQLFTWSAGTGVTEYALRVGSTGVGSTNLYNGAETTNLSAMVNNLPLNGETIYVRLFSLAGGFWYIDDYTFNAFTATASTLNPLSGGSTLSGISQLFTWSAGTGVTQYALRVGSTGVGSTNLYNGAQTTNLSATVNNLPLNGETIYVRLFSLAGGFWYYNDYTFSAFTGTAATLNPISGGTTLSGSSQMFTWTAGSGNTEYELRIGSTGVGSSNLYNGPYTTSTSTTVTHLPTNGETVYVRLFSLAGGFWFYNDYTFNAY